MLLEAKFKTDHQYIIESELQHITQKTLIDLSLQ